MMKENLTLTYRNQSENYKISATQAEGTKLKMTM